MQLNIAIINYYTYTVLKGGYYDLCSLFPLQLNIMIYNATYTVVKGAYYDVCSWFPVQINPVINNDNYSVRPWVSDAINYFAINFRSPGSDIMLRKSDSFRSCNLACRCSGAKFFVRYIMTHSTSCSFNALYGCYQCILCCVMCKSQ